MRLKRKEVRGLFQMQKKQKKKKKKKNTRKKQKKQGREKSSQLLQSLIQISNEKILRKLTKRAFLRDKFG